MNVYIPSVQTSMHYMTCIFAFIIIYKQHLYIYKMYMNDHKCTHYMFIVDIIIILCFIIASVPICQDE